jgi:molecular chaperone GrpE
LEEGIMRNGQEDKGHHVEIGGPDSMEEGAGASDGERFNPEEDPLARLQAELEGERDAHLRSIAELRNYRQRMGREQEEQRKYALAGVLEALIPTLDHLEMALRAAQEHGEGQTALAEGVWMTYRQMVETLGQFGLQAIPAEGQVFDPNRHEALEREEVQPGDPSEGLITAELRRGYLLGERVVRPAQVRVAAANG